MDALGNVTHETFGNGVVTNRTYNPLTSRLETIDTTSNNGIIQNNDYQWQSNGLLTRREQGVNDKGVAEVKYETFNYDDLNRLRVMSTHKNNMPIRTQQTAYDLLGNITSKTSNVASDKQVTGYTYGAAAGLNAVTGVNISGIDQTIRYDSNGNIIHYDANTGDDKYVSWNDRNLPIAITKGTSATDANPQARDSFLYGPDLQRFYKKLALIKAG